LDWKLLEQNCQSQDIAVRKREGFNHELPSLSAHIYERNRRAFVIISDAFRYEAAQELTAELNGKYRFEATLSSQLGVLPSGLSTPEEAKDFARRLRKGAGADHSASGATRVAGTTNYKRKYEPDFPMVRISPSAPGQIMTKERLEEMGLVTAAKPEIPAATFTARAAQGKNSNARTRSVKVWPQYAISLAGAPPRLQGNGPDRSMADYNWCMTAIDWGWSVEDTAAKLPEVSEKAAERVRLNDKGYPLVTAQNAASAVASNDLKRGRG
jgi:hypothetical protein